ncbi:MAG: Rv3235 family protein [Propionibacteriaceae bacterium]|jgi:hypothetical protein|nr:Rv3235 family protein [Propionibacteriaceae bacterium]
MYETATARLLTLDRPLQPDGWRWDARTGAARSAPLPATLPVPRPAARPSHTPRKTAPAVVTVPTGDHHRLQAASTRFAHVVAETLNGQRRLSQLESAFDEASLRVLGKRLHEFRGTPVRLASVRVQPLTPASAEVTLRLVTPHVSHAAALRVTQIGPQWHGSDLVLA